MIGAAAGGPGTEANKQPLTGSFLGEAGSMLILFFFLSGSVIPNEGYFYHRDTTALQRETNFRIFTVTTTRFRNVET